GNDVCQVTCIFGHRQPTTAGASPVAVYSAAAANGCCDPCPQQVCTTRYVQRCWYQPVTTYQTRTYYEPVTVQTTRYFYEAVTSYRYSCYYDPCTCSYQRVATPVTCYQLRSQCCPVQTLVQRCCTVPVTMSQRQCCGEPQTSCCPVNPCATAPVAVAPSAPSVPSVPSPPVIQEQRPSPSPQTPPPPVIQEHKNGNGQQPRQD